MKDFTLILLIKDRPEFFERWVDYTILKKPNYSILISDGGKKKIDKSELLKLSTNKIKYKYKRFCYDKNYRQFCKKIFQSLKICKSKYVSLCADDDFYINESYSRGLNFLKKNKNYVCYGAKMITFGASNKYDIVNSIPTNFNTMYKNNKINDNSLSLKDRLIFFLKNSNFVIFHYIIKRETLKYAYKKILKSNLTIPNLIDIYGNSLIYCKGLVKTSNEIIRMKQYHASSDAKSRDMSNTLVDNKFIKENQELINELIKHVSPKQKKYKSYITREIEKNLYEHYLKGKKAYLKKNNDFKKIMVITFIKNLIMSKNINNIYYYFKKRKMISYFKKKISKITDKKIKDEVNLILKFFLKKKINLN